MKLIYSKTSPYARKVHIAILEKQLEGDFTFQEVDTQQDAEIVRAINPLGKVPALITVEGEVVFDSPVICEFIDTLSGVVELIPQIKNARFVVLRNQALADGLMDAVVAMVAFEKHSGEALPKVLVNRNIDTIHRALNAMENQISALGEAFDLGQISFMSAIGYIELRLPKLRWREMRPKLSAWFDERSTRPSFKSTMPNR